MICFIGVIDIILMSILIKKIIVSRFKKFNKRIKLYQFLKNRNQIETRKN